MKKTKEKCYIPLKKENKAILSQAVPVNKKTSVCRFSVNVTRSVCRECKDFVAGFFCKNHFEHTYRKKP